jgi:zinc transport system permease protein
MFSFLEYDFMQRALIAGMGIAIICPLIGSVLLMKKSVMQADVLSHSALTGVAIGIWLKISPLMTTLIYTTLCSICVEYFRRFRRISMDTMLSLFFSGNLAIAIYLLSLSKGFTSNLHRYLFGSITLISVQDLVLLVCVCTIIWVSLWLFWRTFWQVLLDEKWAKVSWIPVNRINFFLAILIGWGITASLTIVGLLLVSSLLILPLLIAGQVTKSFKWTLILWEWISIASTLFGIIGSYYWDIPSSALITGILVALFGIVFIWFTKNK